MLDPAFLRDTAAAAITARERIAVALATGDAAELYCCGGAAGAAVTAANRAETLLALAADQLHRAARLAQVGAEPVLVAESVPTLVATLVPTRERGAR